MFFHLHNNNFPRETMSGESANSYRPWLCLVLNSWILIYLIHTVRWSSRLNFGPSLFLWLLLLHGVSICLTQRSIKLGSYLEFNGSIFSWRKVFLTSPDSAHKSLIPATQHCRYSSYNFYCSRLNFQTWTPLCYRILKSWELALGFVHVPVF